MGILDNYLNLDDKSKRLISFAFLIAPEEAQRLLSNYGNFHVIKKTIEDLIKLDKSTRGIILATYIRKQTTFKKND